MTQKISRLPRPLLVISSLLGIALIIWLIWQVPQWQARGITDPKDRATIENAARGTFVQALGGLFFLITAYFSLQNLKVAQANLKATQDKQIKDAEVAQANLKVAEEKQVTERFAKAIEQLGNASIHVRLGAIYALERISKDSDKDYWQIMEILTAYVRETSPYPPKTTVSSVEKIRDEENKPLWLPPGTVNNSEKNLDPDNKRPIATDIQAVLTVIGRRHKSYGAGEENRLDLSNTDLNSANLWGADLRNADLRGAHLNSADLRNANFSRTDLRGTDFNGADLSGAILWGTDFNGAIFNGADLTGAILRDAILRDANLSGAILWGTDFNGADLSDANLSDANLSDANLSDANLSDANLSGAKNLTLEQVVNKADNWEKAKYSEEFRAKLGLPPEPSK